MEFPIYLLKPSNNTVANFPSLTQLSTFLLQATDLTKEQIEKNPKGCFDLFLSTQSTYLVAKPIGNGQYTI